MTTNRSPQAAAWPGEPTSISVGASTPYGGDPRSSLQNLENQGFPMPVGHKPVKSLFGVKFVDQGNELPNAAI